MRALWSVIVGSLAFLLFGALDSEARRDANPRIGTIAYSDGGVCLVNADGSGRRCLTRTGIDYAPVEWSSDGERLAFTRIHHVGRDCCAEVRIIGEDGKGEFKLTPRGAEDWEWVAYVSYRGDENGVWVMRSNGTAQHRVTPYTHDSVPTWAP